MSLVQEGLRGVWGAWRIILRRRDALGFFNLGRAGFWRSFAVIAVLLPLSLAWSWLHGPSEALSPLPSAQRWLAEIALEVAASAIWPVGVYASARLTGTAAHWRDFVIVGNWAAPLGWLGLIPAAPLSQLIPYADEPWGAPAILAVVAMATATIAYIYFALVIARTALRANWWQAGVAMLISSGAAAFVAFFPDIIAAGR